MSFHKFVRLLVAIRLTCPNKIREHRQQLKSLQLLCSWSLRNLGNHRTAGACQARCKLEEMRIHTWYLDYRLANSCSLCCWTKFDLLSWRGDSWKMAQTPWTHQFIFCRWLSRSNYLLSWLICKWSFGSQLHQVEHLSYPSKRLSGSKSCPFGSRSQQVQDLDLRQSHYSSQQFDLKGVQSLQTSKFYLQLPSPTFQLLLKT